MKSQSDIENLALLKLQEAECLFANNFFDGAYYLAGYAVELLIKARICKTLNIPDFFLFDKIKKQEMYKPYKSHDYEQLLILSGLFSKFEAQLKDFVFKYHWSVIIDWNESYRYSTGKTQKEVEKFILSIKQIMLWIQKHL